MRCVGAVSTISPLPRPPHSSTTAYSHDPPPPPPPRRTATTPGISVLIYVMQQTSPPPSPTPPSSPSPTKQHKNKTTPKNTKHQKDKRKNTNKNIRTKAPYRHRHGRQTDEAHRERTGGNSDGNELGVALTCYLFTLGNGSFVLNPHGELFGNRYRAKHKESERPNTNKGNVMRKRCLWPRCYC